VLRYGSFFEGLDPSRKTSLLYFPVFTLRRLLFAWTAVFLTDNGLYQIQVFSLCSTFYSLYLVAVRPFSTSVANIVEIVNEFAVFLFSVGLYLLTPMVTDPDARYQIGWCLIGLTSGVMALNISVVTYQTLKEICRKLKKFCRRKMKKVPAKETEVEILDS